jgi:hypothetical protein
MRTRNHNALEYLGALFVAFHNANVYLHSVSHIKRRDIALQLTLFNLSYQVAHYFISLIRI